MSGARQISDEGIYEKEKDGSVYFLTNAVSATTTVTLTASLGGVSKSVPVEVRKEAVVRSLTLSPESAGSSPVVTGMVTLDQPAPKEGTKVVLSSSNPSAATVPDSLLIPEGSTTGTFTMAVSAAAARTAVVISAEFAGLKKTASLGAGQGPSTAGQQGPAVPAGNVSRAGLASTIIVGNWAGDYDRLSIDPEFIKRARGSRDMKGFLAQAEARCKSLRLTVTKDTIALSVAGKGRTVSEISGKYEIVKDAAAAVTLKATPVTREGLPSRDPEAKAVGSRTMSIALSDRNHLRLSFMVGTWDYLKRLESAASFQK